MKGEDEEDLVRGGQVAARLELVMEKNDPPLGARQLSRMMGMSNNTVGGLLFALRRNAGALPSGRTLDRLHAVTGVSIHWLLNGVGPMYFEGQPSTIDAPFPNRGLAIDMARREGMLEDAILAVARQKPDRDMLPIDWYKLIRRFHSAMLTGTVDDSWKWSTNERHELTRSAENGSLAGFAIGSLWWDSVTAGGEKIREAMESFQRFDSALVEGRGVLFEVSGWPVFDDSGQLEGFKGEARRSKPGANTNGND